MKSSSSSYSSSNMFRIQACITFVLLLAAESESFTATRTTSNQPNHRFAGLPHPLSVQQQQQHRQYKTRLVKRKQQAKQSSRYVFSSSSLSSKPSTTAAHLYSAQFRSVSNINDHRAVNNRHSANDYWYNIRTLPSSSILRDIRNPVLAVFGWSTAVSVVHCLLATSGRTLLQSMASRLCVSSAAHSFLVSALGLLLVFRTNSSYQRYYEGRKIWEQILSVSRNLSRLTQLYGREIGSRRKFRLRNLIAAYPYLLRHHIRSGCLCEDDRVDAQHRLLLQEPSVQMVETRHEGDKRCGGSTSHDLQKQTPPRQCWVDRRKLPWSLLTPGALEKVARARNRPLWICDRLAREICDIPYGPNFTNRERQHFLSQVEKLTNAIGQCERIHQTAVPLNYARHSLRSLTIWLFTLPFTLVKDLGFMTGPAAAVIAWLMFGVYEIGYSIEDPFQGSLRLSILCDAIREDVMGLDDNEQEDFDDDDQDMARNSAYEMEHSSTSTWIDEACDQHNFPAQQILAQTYLAAATSKHPSPLFTVKDYANIEK